MIESMVNQVLVWFYVLAPIAVLVGETMFALRRLEADCIEVTPA